MPYTTDINSDLDLAFRAVMDAQAAMVARGFPVALQLQTLRIADEINQVMAATVREKLPNDVMQCLPVPPVTQG